MPVSTTRSELLKKRVDQFTRVLHAVEKGDVRALHQAAAHLAGYLPLAFAEYMVDRRRDRIDVGTRRLGVDRHRS